MLWGKRYNSGVFRNLFTIVAAAAWVAWLATLYLSRNGDDLHNTCHSLGAVAAIVAIAGTAASMLRSSK